MEKKLLLAKSVLQTCFFGIREQKNMAALVACIALLSLFDFMFYNPWDFAYGLGINLFLMLIITLGVAITIHQPALNNRTFWWSSFGAIFSALNICYNPNSWSITMFFVSYFLIVGSLQNKLQNLLAVFLQYLIIQLCSPFYTISFLVKTSNWKSSTNKNLWKITKIAVLPLIAIAAFATMYSFANQHFYNILIEPIVNTFRFDGINYSKIFLWIFGSMFIVPLIIPITFKAAFLKPIMESKKIKRNRNKVNALFNNLDLNNELKISVITMLSLNVLVFLFNILDVIYVWFGSSVKSASELSQYVHDGTNMVILSIIVGSGILIYFFRKNLNFHPKNQWLKKVSYIWLAQNVFLAFSTFTRNLHYVNQFGLTFKRLGVVIFILTVLIGLLFIFQKIKDQHSITHLINRLFLAFYIILIGFSIVDHERLIIQHAAHWQKENVDLYYLTRISTNHDYLLKRHRETLENKSSHNLELAENFSLYKSNPMHEISSWREYNLLADINEDKMEGQYFRVRQNTVHYPVQSVEDQIRSSMQKKMKEQMKIKKKENEVFAKEPIPEEEPISEEEAIIEK